MHDPCEADHLTAFSYWFDRVERFAEASATADVES